jgi:hypothetical protein
LLLWGNPDKGTKPLAVFMAKINATAKILPLLQQNFMVVV